MDQGGLAGVAGVGFAEAHEPSVGVQPHPGPVGPEGADKRSCESLPKTGLNLYQVDAHVTHNAASSSMLRQSAPSPVKSQGSDAGTLF